MLVFALGVNVHEMICPKCNNKNMIEHSLGSGIYRCSNCSSHWLDYKPVESYLVERDQMTAKAFRTIWDLKSDKSPTLKCPRDHSDLNLFSYKGIELDFCMKCKGLWFDALEMENFTNHEDVERFKSIKYSSRPKSGIGAELAFLPFEVLFGILGG